MSSSFQNEQLTRCKVRVNVWNAVRRRIVRMMMNSESLALGQCIQCFEIHVEDDQIKMKQLTVQILVCDRRTKKDDRHRY